VSVEGYWKRLSNLIVYDAGADEVLDEPPFTNEGTGQARGVEFLAHLPRRGFDGWLAYTLGEVRYRDSEGAEEYAPAQDIRHTISAVARVRPGKGWTLGAKWRAQSGRPYTPVVGRENVSEFVDGVDWIPVLGGYNSGRFPWYQRLDVRAERAFRVSGTNVIASLEAVNVLGRRNLYDYRYLDGYAYAEPVTMLPFLPTFGLAVAF
jgi:ferric enterobactin receptor